MAQESMVEVDLSTMDQREIAPEKPKVTKKLGLRTEEAHALQDAIGFNELPHVEVSLWWILFIQFTG